jgi:asparagine synthetase B (glutamine-hydrolysing)
LFAGVRAVEPGRLLRVDAGHAPRTTRWFAPSFIPRTGADRELSDRLGEVVRSQRAGAEVEGRDAPAVLLDGGAGGAAIAALCGRGARTVSVHLAGEEDAGALQARALMTEHTALVLDDPSMAAAVRAVGGPFATPWPLVASRLASAGIATVTAGLGADGLAGAPPSLVAVARGGQLGAGVGRALRRGSEAVADVTLSPLRPWISAVAALGSASEVPFAQRLMRSQGVFSPELLASVVRPARRSALFDVARWSERVIGEASATSQLGRALMHRVRGRVAEEDVPGLDGPLSAAGVELRLPFFDRRALELATGLDDVARPGALEALLPAAVPRLADADEARLARWMGGPLEPIWREAVLGDGSPIATLLELPKLRPLLLADVAWNPGRWRQALALWSLSAWLAS